MGFKFEAVEAKRQQVTVRTSLAGPTGSGKSYSALLLATGMCKELGVSPAENILYLGTENSRDLYYADKFHYKYVPLSAPFVPEMFAEAIEWGTSQNFKVIIIDSASHEWEGEGGILELQAKMPGNSYTNWGKAKERHKKFVDAMVNSDAHIICCMRSKMKHELSQNDKGRTVVQKLGMGVQGDSNLEYEMTVALSLEQDTHIFDSSSKDNTGLFEGRNALVTENDGVNLIKWANDGKVPEKKVALKAKSSDEEKTKQAFAKLDDKAVAKALKDAGYDSIDTLVTQTKEVIRDVYNKANA